MRLPSARIGDVLHATYRLERLIGQGGGGAVFEAKHLRLPRRYAIKLLAPSLIKKPEAIARFQREATVTSELGHPHIVEVVDFYQTDDGLPYFVMELLEGESLAERMRRSPRLELMEALTVLEQTGSALAAAHDRGVIHRDLKPDNIFLCRGRGLHVKVMDFGISKVLRAATALTQAHALLGTPHYMAPEQVGEARRADHRTDVYAMGVILYQMLAGRLPFEAEELRQIYTMVALDDPRPLGEVASVDPNLAEVVHRALAKAPDARQQSMKQLVQEFVEACRLSMGPTDVALTAAQHAPRRRAPRADERTELELGEREPAQAERKGIERQLPPTTPTPRPRHHVPVTVAAQDADDELTEEHWDGASAEMTQVAPRSSRSAEVDEQQPTQLMPRPSSEVVRATLAAVEQHEALAEAAQTARVRAPRPNQDLAAPAPARIEDPHRIGIRPGDVRGDVDEPTIEPATPPPLLDPRDPRWAPVPAITDPVRPLVSYERPKVSRRKLLLAAAIGGGVGLLIITVVLLLGGPSERHLSRPGSATSAEERQDSHLRHRHHQRQGESDSAVAAARDVAGGDAGNNTAGDSGPTVTDSAPVQTDLARQPARPRRPARRAAPRGVGFLTVVTMEGGRELWADVFVDGKAIGRSVIYKRQLPAGRHVVEARREGYSPTRQTVQLRAGRQTRVLLRLRR
jgi:serine/threonine protein kinase